MVPALPEPVSTGPPEFDPAMAKYRMDVKHGFRSSGLQVRVLGVPQQNAKSRVETQIKLCLQLVTDKGDKVPRYSHLRLPEYLVAREKKRRAEDDDGAHPPPDTAVLSLDTVVVCASDIERTVVTCNGCIHRERKRAKKKDSNLVSNFPLGPKGEEILDAETLHLEQKKVVLLNCLQLVDFSSGDTILPTRITCYCRHHGEKLGFCVYFMARDYTGKIVATGMSPPILITDDHKSSKASRPTAARKRARVEEATSTENGMPSPPRRRQSTFRSTSEDELMRLESAIVSPSPAAAQISITPPIEEVLDLLEASSSESLETIMAPTHSEHPISPISPVQSAVSHQSDSPLIPDLQHIPEFAEMQTNLGYLPFHLDNSQFLSDLEPMLDTDYAMLTDYINQSPPDLPSTELDVVGFPASLQGAPQQSPIIQQISQINRVIPAEGPLHGGLEVTILGSGFYDGLTVTFGGIPAARTHFWGETTMVCVLPPSPVPGPVPVCLKEAPGLCDRDDPVFTYKDDADRALMELALQVLGLRMTGKLEDARQVAMRIVADPTASPGPSGDGVSTGTPQNRALAMDALRRSLGVETLRKPDMERLLLQILCDVRGEGWTGPTTRTDAGQTLLQLAIVGRMTTLAKWIVHEGCCELDNRDVNGFTAMHLAAWNGMWSTVLVLLEAGGDRTAYTMQGFQPVHLAVAAGHNEVVRLLLTYSPAPMSSSGDEALIYDRHDAEEAANDADSESSPDKLPASPSSLVPSPRTSVLPSVSPSIASHLDTDDDDKSDQDFGTFDGENSIRGTIRSQRTRFVDRPRRGKRGRGGRGGAGTQNRSIAAATLPASSEIALGDPGSGSDNDDDEDLAMRRKGEMDPYRKVAIEDEIRPTITAEELLFNLTAEEGGAKGKGGSWFTPLAQIPALLAMPITLSAGALFGTRAVAVEAGVMGKTEEPDLPPPPYTAAADHHAHQHHPSSVDDVTDSGLQYPTPSTPTSHFWHSTHDADLIYLNSDLAHIPCDCVSYAGTHETRCTRYQAMLERRREISAILAAGGKGTKGWGFWVPILLLIIIVILCRLLVSNQDVEQLMRRIENVHVDVLGPVRSWFSEAKQWSADQGEEARAWLATVEQKGRTVVRVG
ncbi:SPT3 Dosage dependent suppressor of Ty-induced promoter mutations-like protein, partial [Thoreauomyces humboldtii]